MVRKTTSPKKTTTRRASKPASTRKSTRVATAAKPAAKSVAQPAAKPAVTATVAAPAKTTAPTATLVKAMGKRELIDRVVESSGIKKKAAKPVVEAMLKELGDALARGETLNLQPFGKGIVKNTKELENAQIIELRLRRSKQAMKAAASSSAGVPNDPLVEAAE